MDVSGSTLLCHRGPDNEGNWENEDIKFEHSRLAIIDLTDAGNQPFELTKGKVLVFNGSRGNHKSKNYKIWNFKTGREYLEICKRSGGRV